jgi:hypothetical protein
MYTSVRTEVAARTDSLIRCQGGKYLSSDPVGFLMCLLSFYLKRILKCLLQLYNRPKLHRGTL